MEVITEKLKKLLDNPRTGLKESSDTNKTRHGILALFDEQKEELMVKAYKIIEDNSPEIIGYKDVAKMFKELKKLK